MKANVLVLAALCLSVVGIEAVTAPAGSQAISAGTHLATVRVGGAPVAQSGRATSLNPDRGADLTQGLATFRPAQPGARVVIERRTEAGWTRVASGKQDRGGTFGFLTEAGTVDRPFVFRARITNADSDTVTVSEPTAAEPATLDWHDEFSGPGLNPAWEFRPAPSPARTCSQVLPDNITVSGGTANLTQTEMSGPTPTCPHGRFWTAMMGTQNTKSFRYGTFAARIKFHKPRGMHGAFWIQRAGLPEGARPNDPANNGAEIDIIEYFGDGARKGGLGQNVWWTDLDEAGKLTERSVGGIHRGAAEALGAAARAYDGYHVYSVEWTPEEYIFRIDGKETLRLQQGVSRIPEHLVLSLISSDWELPRYNGGAPATMAVDWVRVWK